MFSQNFIVIEFQVTRELGKTPEGPKHGMVDPLGKRHAGGGMFAGGVGKF